MDPSPPGAHTTAEAALAAFHPHVRQWFQERVGTPTDAQRQAWPAIAAGEHVLLSAPTGSGKTLAACLWGIDQLLTGAWPTGGLRMIYVSPLKALGTDVRRNLTGPLQALTDRFWKGGTPAPTISIQTRSGDTPQNERRKMQRRPPEILVTTPESLNLILATVGWLPQLEDVRAVVLDEIHAIADSKRGTWLLTALEQLGELGREPQRIALSATVRPLERVARLVGGCEELADGSLSPRPVRIVQASDPRRQDIRILGVPAELSAEAQTDAEDGKKPDAFTRLLPALRERIRAHRSTLIFTNGRRMTEKLVHLLNEDQPEPLAFAHHGSLSQDLRRDVERRLKDGDIPAVVATNSLELGIDIGDCEQVLLVQTPKSVGSFVQRLGRAGHQVGGISRGLVFPLHAHDHLEAVVMRRLALAGSSEVLRPPRAALDVLIPTIVGILAGGPLSPDRLFARIRRSWPYHDCSRTAFEHVVDCACGRFQGGKLKELRALLEVMEDGRLKLRAGALRTFYANASMIPDRGYFKVVTQDGGTVAEMDEECVWESKVGGVFAIGAQTWRITAITNDRVEVVPAPGSSSTLPFWRNEAQDRSADVASGFAATYAALDTELRQEKDGAIIERLMHEDACDEAAARTVVAHLRAQAESTGGLPHAQRVILEHAPAAGSQGHMLILHACWGRTVLRPLALALEALWRSEYEDVISSECSDDCLLLHVPEQVDAEPAAAGSTGPDRLLALLQRDDIEARLRQALEGSGFFGARFRECAGRAMQFPRKNPKQRTPLWLTRQRAKELLARVRGVPSFPILAETWRTCLEDHFDLPALRRHLQSLHNGDVMVDVVATRAPSPFAADVVYERTFSLMYADDQPLADGAPSLDEDTLQAVLRGESDAVRIPAEARDALAGRLHRTIPGYTPGSAQEMVDSIEERGLVPMADWRALLASCREEHGSDIVASWWPELDRLLVRVRCGSAGSELVTALFAVPRLRLATGDDLHLRHIRRDGPAEDTWVELPLPGLTAEQARDHLILDLLRATIPRSQDELERWLGSSLPVAEVLARLRRAEQVITGALIAGATTTYWSVPAIFERAVRLGARQRRPDIAPLPLAHLPAFLARRQRLIDPPRGLEALQQACEHLFAYPAPIALWEQALLPARIADYSPALLDQVVGPGQLQWFGCGRRRIAWCFERALPLVLPAIPQREALVQEARATAFPATSGGFTFDDLLMHAAERGEGNGPKLIKRLWTWAWEGVVATDDVTSLRHGLRSDFQQPPPAQPKRLGGFGGWQAPAASAGRWRILVAGGPDDRVQAMAWARQRARYLLERYGVVSRWHCRHELASLGWRELLPALRLMELAGEVVVGRFISGIPGLQFALPETLTDLQQQPDPDAVWLTNACDPCSTCGWQLSTATDLPPRVAGTWILWLGTQPAIVLRRGGSVWQSRIAPDDPRLPQALAHLAHATRPFARTVVADIDGSSPRRTVWEPLLEDAGFRRDYQGMVFPE